MVASVTGGVELVHTMGRKVVGFVALAAVVGALPSVGQRDGRGATPPATDVSGTIAFTRGDDTFVLDVTTMRSHRLVKARTSPAWSPDGSHIASVDQIVWVADADGKNIADWGGGVCDEPAWSPNGRVIACVGPTDNRLSNDSTRPGLWLEYGGKPYHERLLPVGVDWDAGPSWSPDGTRIAFSDVKGFVDIFDLRSRETRSIGRGNSPDWSPRGDAIAYSTGTAIVVARPDGTRRRTLVRSEPTVDQPTWSPGGTAIAYAMFTRNGATSLGLRLVGVAGGKVRVLTKTGYDPDWKPLRAGGR